RPLRGPRDVDRLLPLAGPAGGAAGARLGLSGHGLGRGGHRCPGLARPECRALGAGGRRRGGPGDAGAGVGGRMIGPGTHLPASVKARVLLRSLLLQASWNPKGMQNLGLVYALYPALERLYPDPEKRREAVQRHLSFFNTHPYVAAAIVGGVLY